MYFLRFIAYFYVKKMNTRLLLGCLFISISTSLCTQSDFLDKNWVGQLSLLGQMEYISIQHDKEGAVSFRFPFAARAHRLDLENFQKAAAVVRWKVKRGVADWYFEGERDDLGRISGHVYRNGLKGNFYLYESLPYEIAACKAYLGDFRTTSGQALKLWDTFGRFRIHSPFSEEVSRLRKIGKDRFIMSTGELLHFSKLEDGVFQELSLQLPNGETKLARREAPVQIEKVVIRTVNGDTIGASILLPNKRGSLPAVIMARGAANMDRELNLMDAELLASNGIACLIYDNYGSGFSNGNLRQKNFVDKQKLVIEVFRFLQQHPRIDPSKIGLMGGSQGARIAAMAAAELPETAFLSLRAHPMETRKDQQLYAIGAFLRQQNVQEEVIAKAVSLWERYFTLVHEQKIDLDFVETLADLRSQFPSLMLPGAGANRAPQYPWPNDIYNATKDYLSNIKCPVLSAHGSTDDRVPAQKSIHLLEEGLKAAGNDQLTVLVYEGANHSFTLPGFRIAPGFFMNEINWIKQVLQLDN